MNSHKLARWDLFDEISYMNIEGALTGAASHSPGLQSPFLLINLKTAHPEGHCNRCGRRSEQSKKRKPLSGGGNGLIGGGAHGCVRALDENS
jgi:hypothetical protein